MPDINYAFNTTQRMKLNVGKGYPGKLFMHYRRYLWRQVWMISTESVKLFKDKWEIGDRRKD